jgi:uncharacterized damage-inducible protein DinB
MDAVDHIDPSSPYALIQPGWREYLGHLHTAIAPLTPDQLDLQVAPHLRSLRRLAVHIISGRAWWLHWVMGEGPDELGPMADWDDEGQPAWTAPQILDGLAKTQSVLEDGMARWTRDDLEQSFRHPRRDQKYTRRWMIWHIIEHDLHHGGELSFSLGILGLEGLDL